MSFTQIPFMDIGDDEVSRVIRLMKSSGISFFAIDPLGGLTPLCGVFPPEHKEISDGKIQEIIRCVRDSDAFFAEKYGVRKNELLEYATYKRSPCQCMAATKKGTQCSSLIYEHMTLLDFLKNKGNWRAFLCEIHSSSKDVEMFDAEKPIKERTKKDGWVYFIREKTTGSVKIGKSLDIENRVKLFSVKMPFEIEITHSFLVRDYSSAEKSLHKFFSSMRIDGEWFRLSDADLENINQHFLLEIGIEVVK